ncbi:MAG: L-2-hydroxyglutarate oxidase [Ilumatobacteraceae bacterium]
MSNADVVVVGGGIVGLATALQIVEKRSNTHVVVLEKENKQARHQTGHNSGVIHSGLYYKPGSLKAQMCRDGYERLVEFCRRENIPHQICGKIVVATQPHELPQIEELLHRGEANGLRGIRILSPGEIHEIEPHCTGLKGLFVPQTGIVDYVAVAAKYVERLKAHGAEVKFGETVTAMKADASGATVESTTSLWHAAAVVTCAGLQSDRVAKMSGTDIDLRILPFRGEYFTLTAEGQALIKNLIYPVSNPEFPFLGVHFTRMIGGGVECGPNAVLAFAREGYRKTDINLTDLWESLTWPGFRKVARKYWKTGIGEYYRSFSKVAFTRALKRLVPEIEASHLVPAEAGVRAQACDRTGGLIDDFYIQRNGRVLNVCNAPSPAATASLAIGSSIADSVLGILD